MCFWRGKFIFAAMVLALASHQARAHGTFHDLMSDLAPKIAASPDDPALHVRRAEIFLEHGDWQAALADAELAARKGEAESALGLLRANALRAGGKLQAARPLLDEFVRAHPAHAAALIARARLLRQLGESEPSLNDYRAALKAAGTAEPEWIVETAEALAAANHSDEAMRLLADGIAKLGQVPQLMVKTIDLDLMARRFDSALARIDAASKVMPRPEPWLARRASALAQAGRIAESRAAWLQLRRRLLGLPDAERASHSMMLLLEQANTALISLAAASQAEISEKHSPSPEP